MGQYGTVIARDRDVKCVSGCGGVAASGTSADGIRGELRGCDAQKGLMSRPRGLARHRCAAPQCDIVVARHIPIFLRICTMFARLLKSGSVLFSGTDNPIRQPIGPGENGL